MGVKQHPDIKITRAPGPRALAKYVAVYEPDPRMWAGGMTRDEAHRNLLAKFDERAREVEAQDWADHERDKEAALKRGEY